MHFVECLPRTLNKIWLQRFLGLNQRWVLTVLVNGLVPSRRQATIPIHADLIRWGIFSLPGLIKLSDDSSFQIKSIILMENPSNSWSCQLTGRRKYDICIRGNWNFNRKTNLTTIYRFHILHKNPNYTGSNSFIKLEGRRPWKILGNWCDALNSLRPSDAYMRQYTNHHWFR